MEPIFDRIKIDFQDRFLNDKMTIYVNGCLILENKILTSDTLMGVGITGVSIIITNSTEENVVIRTNTTNTVLNLSCSIVLTSNVRITTILNGHEENFDVDLNKGTYIGFCRNTVGRHLRLSQSKIPFIYD